MFVSHVVRGIAAGTIGILALAGSIHMWHLYGLAVVTGVAGAFFGPASESVLPLLLPAEQLPRGNALHGVAEQGSMIAGPVLGGVLTAWLGPAAAIGLDALTFVIAAITVRSVPRGGDREGSISLSGLLTEVREGLDIARRSHDVRIVLLIISASALSYNGVFSIGLPALARSFSATAVGLGTLISAWGFGQLLGTISAAITGLPRRWGLLIIGMTVVEASAFALLGISPNILTASIILAVVGFGVAYSSDVALPTFIQTRTPTAYLGRMTSILGLPHVLLQPVSIAVLGFLLSRSVSWGFAAAAIPMLIAGIRLSLDPRARRLRTGPEEPDDLHPAAQPPPNPGSAG